MSRMTVNLAVLLMANMLSISSNCPIAINFFGVYSYPAWPSTFVSEVTTDTCSQW